MIALPEGDGDDSGRWKAIKAQFAHSLVKAGVLLCGGQNVPERMRASERWESQRVPLREEATESAGQEKPDDDQ